MMSLENQDFNTENLNSVPNQSYSSSYTPYTPPTQDPVSKSKSENSSIGAKIVTSILFLCIGFSVGTIYMASINKNPSETKSTSYISTVSSNTPATIVNKGDALSIKEVAAMNQDSVVEIEIEAQGRSFFYGNYTTTGCGSGIIISADGYILTNNHVIQSATKIKVRLHDGTEYAATVVGSDAKNDIGIIKVDAKNLKPVTIGDSSKLSVGDTAIVIGNPLGQLGGTVTDGIISALEREMNIEGKKMNLIQTNAAINPGNSGGGLFNSNGELVGIVVAKSSGLDVEGLGFAIPVNDVTNVINDILKLGYVSGRAYLGVSLADSKQEQRESMGDDSLWNFFYGGNIGGTFTTTSYGAYVTAVEDGSAADEAGIKVDDQIISIDNNMCSSSSDVSAAIAEHSVGDKVSIVIVRDNKMQTLSATLKEYKGPAKEEEETKTSES